MQYIKKQNQEPEEWGDWFLVPPGERTYDFGKDRDALTHLRAAKQFLLKEQYHLCAYCQQKINLDNSSIEHVTPKEHNKELSTSYFNLVAVCNRNQVEDPLTGKLHCDKARGSQLIPPLVFYSNSLSTSNRLNAFFEANASGEIIAKRTMPIRIKNQIEAYIEPLNLNHSVLKAKRAKDTLNGLTLAYNSLAPGSHQRASFWNVQYQRILNNPSHPFREFLLVYIGSKIKRS